MPLKPFNNNSHPIAAGIKTASWSWSLICAKETSHQRLPACPIFPDRNLMAFKSNEISLLSHSLRSAHYVINFLYLLTQQRFWSFYIRKVKKTSHLQNGILVPPFSRKPQLEDTHSSNTNPDCHFCSELLILYPKEDSIPDTKLTIMFPF